MQFDMRRVILFTPNVERLSRFYEDVLGLKPVGKEEGWRDFAAGACNIALHAGRPVASAPQTKLVFFARDVAAARASLVKRGAKMGKIASTASFDMCDGRDPDGNRFQISSRK